MPQVTSGFKGLQFLKTTQSGFANFVKDEFTTLSETDDRVLSTIIEAKWTYKTLEGVDFTKAFNTVVSAVCDQFAGPNEVGLYSPSVQKTIYDSQVKGGIFSTKLRIDTKF